MVEKPVGPSSHDCVVRARRALGVRRVGHLGTLDPFASGLLVLLVGPATRLARLAAGWSKTYEGVMRLGAVTDTDDATGTATAVSSAWRALDDTAVETAFATLEGSIEQVPPVYSAKKVAGQRAYRLARQGAAVALAPVTVRIERCTLQRWAPPDAHFVARVSSGTYIRGLAKSAGDVLGCGAHLTKLRRTEVGPFALRDAVAAEDLVPSSLRPIEPLAGGWPRRDIGAEDWEALRHGRPVRDAGEPGTVALFIDGRLSGIAEIEGGALRPRVILTGS